MNNSSKTITVITPVYNMAKYLDLCVTSILKQTFKDFILLLIDDGSTDGSGEICDKYAAMDDRVKVIHTPNQGQGEARNTALRSVETDYIAMIDSDDCVNVRFLEILMKTMEETGADMVVGKAYNFINDDEISIETEVDYNLDKISVFNRNEIIYKLCTEYDTAIVTPQKLYKKWVLDGIVYQKIGVNIDEWVIHHMLLKIDNIAFVNTQIYYYRYSPEGMTRNFSLKKISGIRAMLDRIQTLENAGYTNCTKDVYSRFFSMSKRFYKNMKVHHINGMYLLKPLKKELNKAYKVSICQRTDLYSKKEMIAQWLFPKCFWLYGLYCKIMNYDLEN